MKVSNEDCEEFVRLCREVRGIELTLDEARQTIANLSILFERFGAWLARTKVSEWTIPFDGEPAHNRDG